MTRLYLNSRGLYATGPDSPAEYTVPDSHVCGMACRIGWHVNVEPYHVETCANCPAVIEREGSEWVHRDGGSRHCWPHGERRPRTTVAAPARTED